MGKRRSLARYGYEQTRPHLFMTEADLDLLTKWATTHDTTLSEWIERIVRAWCVERRALDKGDLDDVQEDILDRNYSGRPLL